MASRCCLSERRWVRVIALSLFVVATALRYNALGATAPLVVLLFQWKPDQRWLVRYAISAATWLGVVVLAMGLNAALTDKPLHYWQKLERARGHHRHHPKIDHEVPDSELGPLLAPTEIKVDENFQVAIRAKYRPADFQQLISGEGNLWDVPLTDPMPIARRDAVQHAWATLVQEYPGPYLRYRLESFGETLGVYRKFKGATS